jgi:recombination protein U
MNVGKRFEADIKASIPEGVLFYRFRDSPNSFGGYDDVTRFTPSNVCDCFMFKVPYFYLLELKTTKGKSYPLNKSAYKQLERFRDLGDYENVIKAFVINYRDYEKTYLVPTERLENFLRATGKKSIRMDECHEIGMQIGQKKLRVNYRYDIDDIFKLEGKENEVLKLFDTCYGGIGNCVGD